MKDDAKALTHEEAKQLCRMAFDGGADYCSTSMQYHCNAVAYDWEHWLNKNERLFMPKPTVEDLLDEFASAYDRISGEDEGHQEYLNLVAEFAAKLRLAEMEGA